MTRYTVCLLASGLSLMTLPLHAHHPISDVYDEERTVILEGEVASFLFGNPHSMVHLRVPDPNGAIHTWAVEWRAARRLGQMGWSAGALMVGDRVMICGNPGRDPGAYRMYLLNVAHLPADAAAGTQTTHGLCESVPPGAHTRSPARRSAVPRHQEPGF